MLTAPRDSWFLGKLVWASPLYFVKNTIKSYKYIAQPTKKKGPGQKGKAFCPKWENP